MITLYTYEQWHEQKLKSCKTVNCPDCEGAGEIEEDLMSSQGNWHTVYDFCERCEGSGEIDVDDLSETEKAFDSVDYFNDQVNVIKAYCSWKRIPLLDGMCMAKQLFS